MTTTETPYDYPRLRAWVITVLLFVAGIVSAVDRGVLNMVVDPVRHDLNISEVQISLVQGLAFGLFYATVGIPLGLFVDRTNRVRLLACAIVVWSMATMYAGCATDYQGLFVSRMIMGLGEATLGPCSLSLIADMFAPERRGLPISVHMAGGAMAGGIGVMLVGYILAAAPLGAFDHIPAAAGVAPWRLAFIFTGATGLVVAAALLIQREPERRNPGRNLDIKSSLRYLKANASVFAPFYGAFVFKAIAGMAFFSWTATILMRRYDMGPGEVGGILGGFKLFAGLAGALIGGQFIDMRARHWGAMGKLKMLAILPLGGFIASFAGLSPNGVIAAVMLCAPYVVFPMSTIVVLSLLSEWMPGNMRGVSVSILGVCSSFLGATIGPFLVAFATAHILKDPAQVGIALMLVAAPAFMVTSLAYLFTARQLRRSLERGGSLAAVIAAKG